MRDIINGASSEYEIPKQPTLYDTANWKIGKIARVIPQIKVIEHSDKSKFENKVNECLKNGYHILSTNCGFVNSEQYDVCSSYQAILIFK